MKYFSGFSGIGGFDEGIRRVLPDAECIGYSEIDKYAIKIYEKHFPDRTNYGDIRRIDAGTLPNFDVFCGGFPCQDLSIAGKRSGLCGARSGLFYEIIRIIREKQPRIVFLENVKGLFSSNGGWDFARVLVELDGVGYDVEWQCLNSKNFGVPQNRERVFIIGHRKDISWKPVFPIVTNICNENDNEYYGIEKVYILSKRISENIRVLSVQGQGKELLPTEMQELSKQIYGELQAEESREVYYERSIVQQNTEGDVQEVKTIREGTRSPNNTAGVHNMVQLPTEEMLLLWYDGGRTTNNTRCIQQQNISIVDRQTRFFQRLRSGEYSSLLLAVQSYKERLFYSIGDGRDWIKICSTKLGEKANTLSSILEPNPDKKYFLSDKTYNGLFNGQSKPELINESKESIRTLTAGGHSGGLHSSMTLIQIGNVDTKGHNSKWGRIYDSDGIAPNITGNGGGMGAKTGLILQPINFGHKAGDGTVTRKHTLTDTVPSLQASCGGTQQSYVVQTLCDYDRKNGIGDSKDVASCIGNSDWRGLNRNQKQNAVMVQRTPLKFKGINQKHFDKGDYSFTVDGVNTDGIMISRQTSNTVDTPGYLREAGHRVSQNDSLIRRLTPLECERLQAYPDGWTASDSDGKPLSDSQRYKMLGNAVTVNVIEAIIRKVHETNDID